MGSGSLEIWTSWERAKSARGATTCAHQYYRVTFLTGPDLNVLSVGDDKIPTKIVKVWVKTSYFLCEIPLLSLFWYGFCHLQHLELLGRNLLKKHPVYTGCFFYWSRPKKYGTGKLAPMHCNGRTGQRHTLTFCLLIFLVRHISPLLERWSQQREVATSSP